MPSKTRHVGTPKWWGGKTDEKKNHSDKKPVEAGEDSNSVATLERAVEWVGERLGLGESGRQLLRIIVRPGTVVNLVHPFMILLLITFLPHNLWWWLQLPLYCIVFKLLWIWCSFVASLKENIARGKVPALPAVAVCQTDSGVHCHTKEVQQGQEQGQEQEQGEKEEEEVKEVKQEEKAVPACGCRDPSCGCGSKHRPFLWVGELGGEEPRRPTDTDIHAWLNKALDQVWISSRGALEDLIMNVLWPEVRATIKQLPTNIDVELYSFGLGQTAPRVEDIVVLSESLLPGYRDDLVLDLKLSWASKACLDFRLQTDLNPKIKLRLDSLVISVKARLEVVGLMGELPLLRGFSFCLLEPPQLGWRLGGLGKITSSSYIERVVLDLILQQLETFVSPHKICLPLTVLPGLPQGILDAMAKHDQREYDRVILPEPSGVVRVEVAAGRRLPACDYSSFSLRTLVSSPRTFWKQFRPWRKSSDPYVRVDIGGATQQSAVHFGNLDPEFNFICEMPVEEPRGQRVTVKVWDFDKMSSDDLLGSRQEELGHLVKVAGQGQKPELEWMALSQSRSGEVLMRYSWMACTPHPPPPGMLAKAGLLAVSCLALTPRLPQGRTSPLHPTVRVTLQPPGQGQVQGQEQWVSLPCLGPKDSFRLGELTSPTMDLMLLQGGMLRWSREQHTHILVEVEDELHRSDEMGHRVWQIQVPLWELEAAAKEDSRVSYSLEQCQDRKANCPNYTKRMLDKLWERLRQKDDAEAPLVSVEGEGLQADFQVKFYYDKMDSATTPDSTTETSAL